MSKAKSSYVKIGPFGTKGIKHFMQCVLRQKALCQDRAYWQERCSVFCAMGLRPKGQDKIVREIMSCCVRYCMNQSGVS